MGILPQTKECKKCGETKSIDEFSYKRNACKKCERLRYRAYYLNNRDKSQVATRKWQTENRDRHLDQKREYRQSHHEKVRAYQKAYNSMFRSIHGDKKRARGRKWYAANREKELVRLRAYYAAHPDKRRASIRASKARNPEIRVREKQRRHARIQANGGNFTSVQWKAMCNYFGNVCLCCGDIGPLTVDHVIPISIGGGNDISNIQPLCMACNMKKMTNTTDYRDADQLTTFLEQI